MISKATLDFLTNLKNNNNREWFTEHKKEFQTLEKEYKAFANELVVELSKTDSIDKIQMFRIYRDVRFSKDKSPYKTNLGIWFSTRKNQKNAPGYYIHYEKGSSFIAAGIHCPEPEDLKKIRKEIAFFQEDLEEILANPSFKKEYGSLDRDESNVLKKAPKDYDPNHPAIEFLKLKSFTATQKIDDSLFTDNDFAKKMAKKLIILKPLTVFLNRALETIE